MDPEPWTTYKKAPLPRGFRYPVGRDTLQRELERAGLRVDSLSLSRPVLPVDPDHVWLVGVHVGGGAVLGLSRGGPAITTGHLSFSVLGVPASVRERLSDGQVLDEIVLAIRWTVDTLARGNAWLSSDHDYSSALTPSSIVRTPS